MKECRLKKKVLRLYGAFIENPSCNLYNEVKVAEYMIKTNNLYPPLKFNYPPTNVARIGRRTKDNEIYNI